MLIDLHAHSKGISRCCKKDGKDIIMDNINVGLDGMILTNHYDKSYVETNAYDLALRYVNEYNDVKSYGKNQNFKVFFGIELTMSKHNDIHMLIYGVDENFILNYPDIYDYSIEKLYQLVKRYNGYLVQAHPFRKGKNVLLDLNYLDGIEANCHPKYDGSYIDLVSKIALENNLFVTCGGDYHADIYRVKCGVYIKDDIDNTLEIMKYLNASNEIKLCIQEFLDEPYDYIYKKRKEF